jgi:hypothetical protein
VLSSKQGTDHFFEYDKLMRKSTQGVLTEVARCPETRKWMMKNKMMIGAVLALSLPFVAGASVVLINGATGNGNFADTTATGFGTTGANLSSATTKAWNYASTEADWAITGGLAVADSVAGTGLGQIFLKSNYGTAWEGATQITLSADWTTLVAGDTLSYSIIGWKNTGSGVNTFGLASGTIIAGSTYYSAVATDVSSFLSGGDVLATIGSGAAGSGTFSTTLDVVGTDLADYDALSIVFFSTVGSGGQVTIDNVQLSAIPEPATIGMLGLGAIFTLLLRRQTRPS